ncbi:receptor-like protein kinase [Musa troglodytarum]|uniref:non-specific serine/threonine protein kinase n=1 Tax=Musa troglodytarum TaxID=320322 RepID=A0A9E7KX93_9LILI|nr:receptor-like protein kinase [Musa troglodytarum]
MFFLLLYSWEQVLCLIHQNVNWRGNGVVASLIFEVVRAVGIESSGARFIEFLTLILISSISSMLKSTVCFYFLAILPVFLVIPISSSLSPETKVLLEIKSYFKDPFNYLESWSELRSSCEFTGIHCDIDSGHVIGISLPNISLSGKISPSISLLPDLTTLELGENAISGVVPSAMANCTNLRVLNLSANFLTGQLPDLSSLQKLQVLDLSKNSFDGRFPAWVTKTSGLVKLVLAKNDFDAGEMPENIGSLKNLTWLFLANCKLRGEMPASIYELTSLETLDLSHNQISGQLSKAISNLSKLYKIEIYQNNLTGVIPPEVANLTLLREFDISGNRFTGKLPPEIGSLERLTVFHVYMNNFSGELPRGFEDLKSLVSFSLYQNSFSGELPSNLGRFSPLEKIDISENNFAGDFPRFLCQNKRLQFLLALDNNFSGEFPESYGECKTLIRFRICQNSFTGRVPDGLWGLPSAVIMDLADNGFIGGISSEIGMSASLTQLYLQNNRFSEELPGELGNLSQLYKLFAHNNSFSGQIPSQFGNLKNLSFLHLQENALAGTIPSALGTCDSLIDLNLAHNSLCDNQLSGEVPAGILLIASEGALYGNEDLCIDTSNQNHRQLRSCSSSNSYKDARWKPIVVVLTILRDLEEGEDKDSKWMLQSFHPMVLNRAEILDLDEANLIASGGTGKVYRLDLNRNRGTVAVKKLWNTVGESVLAAEIGTMVKIRHRNIVKLYACLITRKSKYLVLEYMPNGNLYQALRREMKGGRPELDWNKRYMIAVGAAKAIMYLHHDCNPAIIHRDIKSANILLDEEYEAKIADFGIATVDDGSEWSCLAGTHGYIAPELACSLRATKKSDVYSFGVVLLELITGRCPTDPHLGEEDIVSWISSHFKGQDLAEAYDPRLSSFAAECMAKVLEIAIRCTTKRPSSRPTMREVVNMLTDANPASVVTTGKSSSKNW